ncbi:hypothetical protein VNO77_50007 [Canavalia gladiata]|uniref:Uncharacterized protein n=1 Tax=Canavalia gladiata TaxID=3824 RepID=A0AAN9PGC4_CANGL
MATGLTLSDVGELLIDQKVSQPRQFRKAILESLLSSFRGILLSQFLSFDELALWLQPEDGPKRQASRRGQSSGSRLKEIRGWGRIVYVTKKQWVRTREEENEMSRITNSVSEIDDSRGPVRRVEIIRTLGIGLGGTILVQVNASELASRSGTREKECDLQVLSELGSHSPTPFNVCSSYGK